MGIADDRRDEPAETFRVVLVTADVADVDPKTRVAAVTIEDNDAQPTVSVVDDPVVTERSGTSAVVATLRVRLSARSSKPVRVDYQTLKGTAAPDADFVARDEVLQFAAG